MKILIVNGPNLNMLQYREARYGDIDFETYLDKLKGQFPDLTLAYYQSNHEGALIDKLQEASRDYEGVILNAGGFTHTSVALRDTIALLIIPVVEVHITDILSRESFRQQSLIAEPCTGSIIGFGLQSYDLGIQALMNA